jgi:hypothetical protein
MFRPDLQAMSRGSSMTYAAYGSTYILEFPQVINLMLCLQFLKSKLWLNKLNIELE